MANIKKETVTSNENADSLLKGTATDFIQALSKKEEALKEELNKVIENKYEASKEVPSEDKSIAELIREQRALRSNKEADPLRKLISKEAQKYKNRNRPGSSRFNPIVVGGGK